MGDERAGSTTCVRMAKPRARTPRTAPDRCGPQGLAASRRSATLAVRRADGVSPGPGAEAGREERHGRPGRGGGLRPGGPTARRERGRSRSLVPEVLDDVEGLRPRPAALPLVVYAPPSAWRPADGDFFLICQESRWDTTTACSCPTSPPPTRWSCSARSELRGRSPAAPAAGTRTEPQGACGRPRPARRPRRARDGWGAALTLTTAPLPRRVCPTSRRLPGSAEGARRRHRPASA